MKNKFLQISIGVSMMLLSAGFLIRSVNSAGATPAAVNTHFVNDLGETHEWPFGISDGYAYYLEYDGSNFGWHKVPLTNFN